MTVLAFVLLGIAFVSAAVGFPLCMRDLARRDASRRGR